MATDLSFVEFVIEQSRLGDQLTHKKMFGEYGLYLHGKMVALACDNSLFVKPAAATSTLTERLRQRPPYPSAKPHFVADELIDEPEQLRELLLATGKALPQPRLKTPKRREA